MPETPSDVYDDRILEARDVCRNCLRLVKVERLDPTKTGMTREYERSYERDQRNTSIEYAPADRVSEQKGVFCECGTEHARTRIWEDADVDRERFRELVKHLISTLRRKGLNLHASRTAGYALQARQDGATVDAALRQGVSAGLRARTNDADHPQTTA